MPLTDNGLEGFVPVSFTTERESFASPELQEWLKSGLNRKNGPESKEISDEAKGEAVSLSNDLSKGRSVQLENPPSDAPFAPGDGGSQQGKDLVFRVKSPLKLYHLARLYDFYDGRYWKVSRALRWNRERQNGKNARCQTVKLTYFQEKLFSRNLAAPWKMVDFRSDETVSSKLRYTCRFWGVELQKQPEKMPFRFTVESELPSITANSDKTVTPPWPESAARSNFLLLPRNRISMRVRLLARSLTAGLDSPYAKAVALRDFLRNNCTYKLEAAPTPPHRESVDYFIFYLREGHCEYFASALAVLARCAGLPSRVATGFSPGNYNTLTTLFEVYEYHAHAWTQIYIPEYGWLTFDATPPSAVVSETSPPGFGKMRDPFGDEWRVRPPELTDNTLDYMQKLRMLEERKKQGESNVEQALNEIAAAGDKLKEELSKEHRKKENSHQLQKKKGILDLQTLRLRIIVLFKKFQHALVEIALYVISSWTRLLGTVALLIGTALLFLWLFKLMKRGFRIMHFLWLCRKGGDFSDPRKALRSSCHAALALLELKNMGRNNNQELLEYADSLPEDTGRECREIFKLFYQAEYRCEAPGTAEAKKGAFHLERLRQCFKKRSFNG